MAIVGATVALSKQLGLSLIAEGVEDTFAADVLRRIGCDEAQGYFYGKPMPASDFLELLNKQDNKSTTFAAA